MPPVNWPEDSQFDPFNIFEETYKIVSGHEIKAAVLIPQTLKPGLHPVIVNIHGGFFATAHSLFAPFFAPWALELAIDHGAIIVSADYRLLPTPNGVADQLEDLEDFWQWYREDLPSVLERNAASHKVDYNHALLMGGSAGGYFAAQLGMSHPDDVSALALVYPAVDLRDEIWTHGPAEDAPTVLRFPAEDMASKDEALAWVAEQRKTVESKGGLERVPFLVALTQHGLFTQEVFEYEGVKLRSEELPLERLKAGAKLPKAVWVIHGDDDSVVYFRQSQALVELIQEKLPGTRLRFDIGRGQDHGFDVDPRYWNEYADPAMAFVSSHWLS